MKSSERASRDQFNSFFVAALILLAVPSLLTGMEHLVYPDNPEGESFWAQRAWWSTLIYVLFGAALAALAAYVAVHRARLRGPEALKRDTEEAALEELQRYKAVVTTVGMHGSAMNPPKRIRDAPVAHLLATPSTNIERVVVVGTKAGEGFRDDIGRDFKDVHTSFIEVSLGADMVRDAQAKVGAQLQALINEFSPEEVLLDYTGGFAALTAGVVLAAEEKGVDMLYISNDELKGKLSYVLSTKERSE